jgi:hypothetical protein
MENFWDLLFQLMKNGTTTLLHVAFIFLFSVYVFLVDDENVPHMQSGNHIYLFFKAKPCIVYYIMHI